VTRIELDNACPRSVLADCPQQAFAPPERDKRITFADDEHAVRGDALKVLHRMRSRHDLRALRELHASKHTPVLDKARRRTLPKH
jgi:hypothetical protein